MTQLNSDDPTSGEEEELDAPGSSRGINLTPAAKRNETEHQSAKPFKNKPPLESEED